MKTILTISDSYYQTRVNTFFQSSYQTSLALWGNYSQSILHTFQDIKLYWHFQRVTAKQYCTLFQSLHQKILTFSESSFTIKLHLIYVTLWTRVISGLLISMLGKLSWFLLNGLRTMFLKMDGSVLEEKSSFKILGLTFSSRLDWDSYIFSITKTSSEL